MQLLDTHQHLIYPDKFAYDWTRSIPPLHGAFTLETYTELAKTCGIDGALFMEAAPDDAFYQGEVRFIRSLMQAGTTIIRGIIAGIRPEIDMGFDAWLDETDSDDIVGYRRALHVVPDEVSTTDSFRRNVRKVGARNKTFDLCVTQKQLPIGRDLARACPETLFVLDHCGVPAIAVGDFAEWLASMVELAALPNVVCKISGVGAYVGNRPRRHAVQPYVESCLDLFGPDRVVWGGDWPVVNLAAGLSDWVEATRELTASLNVTDRGKLFTDNAKRIYRIKRV